MTDPILPRQTPQRKRGNEHFISGGDDLAFNLLEFWQWSAWDVLEPEARQRLAEFIVAKALRIPLQPQARDPWALYSFTTRGGMKLEVQSASYLQSWEQKRLTRPTFSIGQTRGWNAEAGWYNVELPRQSDAYIFALLKHEDKETVDPLNLDQWEFYVVPTEDLNRTHADEKNISLAAMQKLAGDAVGWEELHYYLKERMKRD